MGMLGTTYLDDSADQLAAKVFIAAGFFCPDGSEWKRLRREWRKVLKPRRIPYYRTYDWRTLTGAFGHLAEKWGPEKARVIADKIRMRLEALLESSPVLAGFGMGINMQDFREVDATPEAKSNRQWMRECHDYQTAAFRNVFCRITYLLTEKVDPELLIAFVCDDSTHYRKIKRGYDRIKVKFPDLGRHMISLVSKDDKRVPELQMADLMADVAREATTKSIANAGAFTPPSSIKTKVLSIDCWNKSGMLKVLSGETPGA